MIQKINGIFDNTIADITIVSRYKHNNGYNNVSLIENYFIKRE